MKFNFTDKYFNLINALHLAEASSLAYEDCGIIEQSVKEEWEWRDFNFIEKDDTECFTAASADVIFLVFRGTEQNSLKDWITDFKFPKRIGPWRLGIHHGFKTALEVVWSNIYSNVSDLNKVAKRPLFVAGHSLGGALATLAVAKFLEAGESVSAMYTYGQPMVGSTAFAEKFNRIFKCAYRLVNNEDIVTRVPFKQFNRENSPQLAAGW